MLINTINDANHIIVAANKKEFRKIKVDSSSANTNPKELDIVFESEGILERAVRKD